MAENKKSFLLYADYEEVFEELSDIDAGQLAKHLFRYVNDRNPVTENPLVRASFILIKKQLKRDLIRWEEIRIKRSDAGKASAESRKQNQQMLTSVESVKQTPTKSTVNVNDNVTVNDTVIDIIKKNKAKAIYFDNKELNDLFIEHLKIRSKIKAVNSEIAITGLINKLNSLTLNVKEQILVVEQSIMNSWKSYFPLKIDEKAKKSTYDIKFN